MKENKFRGQRVDNGELVNGYYLPWHAVRTLDNKEQYAQIYDDVSKDLILVYAETVGQYTGLKDRNGTEIYEGDIVAINKELLGCYVIKYDENQAKFSMYINGYEQAGFNKVTMKAYEVIGNVYDNPELLEETI